MEQTRVAIVGGGPIGIELAVALKRAGLGYVQIEAGAIGSTIHWYAPGTTFFSSPERIAIAGVPLVTEHQEKPTREEYLNYLRGVVQQFALAMRMYTRVGRIERVAYGGFALELQRSFHGVGGPAEAAGDHAPRDCPEPASLHSASSRPGNSPMHFARGSGLAAEPPELLRAEKVVLAIGNLHRPRPAGVPGESLPHVSHYFGDPHLYFGKRVLIVGGRNSAVEAAIRLVRVGCDVSLSYRREWFDAKSVKYWLLPELEFLIKKGRIRFFPGTVPVEITTEAVRLAPAEGSAAESIEVVADFVLLLLGYAQDQSLLEQAGVRLEGERRIPVYDRDTMETNVAGLYVAGTAAAGMHQGQALEFIETSHVHVDRIVASLTGQCPPVEPVRDPATLES